MTGRFGLITARGLKQAEYRSSPLQRSLRSAGHRARCSCGAYYAAARSLPSMSLRLTVGRLLGRSGTTDIVEATVVTIAIRKKAEIVSSDRDDISRFASAAGVRLIILET